MKTLRKSKNKKFFSILEFLYSSIILSAVFFNAAPAHHSYSRCVCNHRTMVILAVVVAIGSHPGPETPPTTGGAPLLLT